MAPEVGFEPTTNRLTADRSTTELLRIRHLKDPRRARPGKKLNFYTRVLMRW